MKKIIIDDLFLTDKKVYSIIVNFKRRQIRKYWIHKVVYSAHHPPPSTLGVLPNVTKGVVKVIHTHEVVLCTHLVRYSHHYHLRQLK